MQAVLVAVPGQCRLTCMLLLYRHRRMPPNCSLSPLAPMSCRALTPPGTWLPPTPLHSSLTCPPPFADYTQELGTLLDVAPHKAEGLAADMIGEGRLSGRIDQVRWMGPSV
jgi:hypothetical protein